MSINNFIKASEKVFDILHSNVTLMFQTVSLVLPSMFCKSKSIINYQFYSSFFSGMPLF